MRLMKCMAAAVVCMAYMAFSPMAMAQNEYWHQRVSLFEELPVNSSDIIFLGNSITDGGEFAELFDNPNVKNRGINSDVIGGVKKRLSHIVKGHPDKIFLLIGINDISHNLTVAQLISQYEDLVKEIRKASPPTTLYVQTVMPINNEFKRYKNLIGKEQTLKKMNEGIKRVAESNNAIFIDLWPVLADQDGKLHKNFTNDGLHLNGKGYKAWAEFLRPIVNNK